MLLGTFLRGDIDEAYAVGEQSLQRFRELGSLFQIADGLTLLAAVGWRRNDPEDAWKHLVEAIGIFRDLDLATGLGRALGMASILQLRYGDADFGARIAGATEQLHQTKNVMIAPVKVLHMPDGGQLAVEVLGAERAATLMADGAAAPVLGIVEEIIATPSPARAVAI